MCPMKIHEWLKNKKTVDMMSVTLWNQQAEIISYLLFQYSDI